jgi:hypothetical protein
LFDDDVGVGAADAEGGDGGASGVVGGGPGGVVGEEAYVSCCPVDVGGGFVDVEGFGHEVVVDGLDHFDDAADAGCGLGVADVGFEGSEPEGVVGGVGVAVGGEDGVGFDGVAEAGAGAVGFDDVDVGGGEVGVGEGAGDDALLCGSAGG